MKPISITLFLLVSFFSTWLLPGCGGGGDKRGLPVDEGYEVIVEFPAPVLEYQAATQTLKAFLLIPIGNDANCQDLISGTHEPGDDRYLIENAATIAGSFTENPHLVMTPPDETKTYLVFVDGEDSNGFVMLRGCTMLNPGDNTPKLTLSLVAL